MAKRDSYHSAASGGGGAVYALGLVGAFIFFMQQAHNFWQVIVGTLQALVWPAYVVYKLLESFYR